MNIKRAILCGALFWVLVFFEVSILMFGFKLEKSNLAFLIAHYVLMILIILIVSLVYFKTKTRKIKALDGILFGISILVVATILDILITVPLWIPQGYSFFFFDWTLWLGYLEVLILSILFALAKK